MLSLQASGPGCSHGSNKHIAGLLPPLLGTGKGKQAEVGEEDPRVLLSTPPLAEHEACFRVRITTEHGGLFCIGWSARRVRAGVGGSLFWGRRGAMAAGSFRSSPLSCVNEYDFE